MSGNQATPVLRILYRSKAHPIRNTALSHRAIEEIVAASRRRNLADRVTGVLLKVEDTFIQVIEGEQGPTEAAFERICCDERHSGLVLVDMTTANHRLFPAWSMAYVASDELPPRLQINVKLKTIAIAIETRPDTALEQMQTLLE
ncbi:BLUF domain-containing protein [Jiella mangrovi]|uniref:BLUF domain-containing protein n=1 Tax=Jiella mangrovi TaxID=2821407 RepID=A0ABS4BD88_9HYPH|nr:BLUF domain-containing protein [Jiella mangrovi]MBP0614686.1 BLUF domain-containing protein [Jiella mangrovi]